MRHRAWCADRSGANGVGFYRLYFMDRSGRVNRAELLEAGDDEAARTEAIRLDHAFSVELWQAERLVGVVYPDEPIRGT
jgi:hypothetical protein